MCVSDRARFPESHSVHEDLVGWGHGNSRRPVHVFRSSTEPELGKIQNISALVAVTWSTAMPVPLQPLNYVSGLSEFQNRLGAETQQ